MLPALWSGDSVFVRHADPADLRPGEVAVFARDGQFVVHRVVRVVAAADDLTVITRGDTSLHDDSPVSRDEFLGVVAGFARVGGHRPATGTPRVARGVAPLLRQPGALGSLLRRVLVLAAHARDVAARRALRDHG